MADFNKFIPRILKAECNYGKIGGFPRSWNDLETLFVIGKTVGFVNHPLDEGGATMAGVTLATYRQAFGAGKTVEDLKRISFSDWKYIYKSMYWDKMKADDIRNQSVAELCVDWLINSGVGKIKSIQSLVGTVADGRVGPKTIAAINSKYQPTLFLDIKRARIGFYNDIVKRKPSQSVFLKGWLNRLEDFKFSD